MRAATSLLYTELINALGRVEALRVVSRTSTFAYLKANPIFDDLRTDSRFTALLRKIGLN